MKIPEVPRWLTLIGLAGNIAAGTSFLIQGHALWLLFAAAIAVNVLSLMTLGGRTTDPLPDPPLIKSDRMMRAETLALRARQHNEWDTAYRLLCPPTKDAVWKRRTYEITDFNN